MSLQKNKKNTTGLFTVLFFSLLFFVVLAPDVLAQANTDPVAQAALQANITGEEGSTNFVVAAFKSILYALLRMLTGLVQVGASVFAWTTRPEYISGPTGLLNLNIVYELWKFIRDFFNLSFIFLLLFAAFSTVFQIEKFGLKKNFFKIVLAAIVINFSFPLVRMVIDLGNVPMYFFAQGIVNASGAGNSLHGVTQSFFQSSGMADLLLNPGPRGPFLQLLTAIIFTFIFMITLFTLAFLFLLRLLKLVILLIFSPLGLAASVIPGLEKFGGQYWGNLMQTVFFGPAAMLMVVIALRFSQEIQGSQFATGLGATAPAATATSQSSVIRQGMFFIPIILMWMAMHLGNKFGIEGANAVMKKADAVAAWGKRQALFAKGSGTRKAAGFVGSPVTSRVRGFRAGIKSRFDDKIGTPLKNRQEAAEARAEATAKGLFTREAGSLKRERAKADAELLNKRAREQEKKWKDDGKTLSEIASKLTDKKSSDVERLAAASLLASEKEGLKDPEVLKEALAIANETKNKDLFTKALNAATDDALDLNPEQLRSLKEGYKAANYKVSPRRDGEDDATYDNRIKAEEKKFDEAFEGMLKGKFKKEGKIKVLIDYDIAENKRRGIAIPHREVYAKYMDKMKAKEIAQMKDIYDETTGDIDKQVSDYIKNQKWSMKDKQDAFAELSSKQKKAWKKAGIDPS